MNRCVGLKLRGLAEREGFPSTAFVLPSTMAIFCFNLYKSGPYNRLAVHPAQMQAQTSLPQPRFTVHPARDHLVDLFATEEIARQYRSESRKEHLPDLLFQHPRLIATVRVLPSYFLDARDVTFWAFSGGVKPLSVPKRSASRPYHVIQITG